MDNRSVHLPGEHPAIGGEDLWPQGRRCGRRRPITMFFSKNGVIFGNHYECWGGYVSPFWGIYFVSDRAALWNQIPFVIDSKVFGKQ